MVRLRDPDAILDVSFPFHAHDLERCGRMQRHCRDSCNARYLLDKFAEERVARPRVRSEANMITFIQKPVALVKESEFTVPEPRVFPENRLIFAL